MNPIIPFQKQTLDINEVFFSIQGESSLTGLPTTFVRLSRCNLRCLWCDTSYSFKRGKQRSFAYIMEKIRSTDTPHVCITGGEPLLQKNVYPFMTWLCDENFLISLETGGSLPIDPVDPRVKIILDVKCPSSGMMEKNDYRNLEKLKKEDEVKFVIGNEEDYAFAVETCHKFDLFKQDSQVLFSSVFGALEPLSLVEWILRDKLKVRLNLQMHKYVWPPETIGV